RRAIARSAPPAAPAAAAIPAPHMPTVRSMLPKVRPVFSALASVWSIFRLASSLSMRMRPKSLKISKTVTPSCALCSASNRLDLGEDRLLRPPTDRHHRSLDLLVELLERFVLLHPRQEREPLLIRPLLAAPFGGFRQELQEVSHRQRHDVVHVVVAAEK